ncbi:MAG: hypothetical protein K0Q59_3300 [Paenibacillus sp.]|nr:hypothetical protein [Paenibacillus sp.]
MSNPHDRQSMVQPFTEEYTDLATVESQRNDLAPEEFPEGSYGSNIAADTPAASRPWREEQRKLSAFTYEARHFHEGMERAYPGDYDIIDDEDEYPSE